jgi:hypothetical protein
MSACSNPRVLNEEQIARLNRHPSFKQELNLIRIQRQHLTNIYRRNIERITKKRDEHKQKIKNYDSMYEFMHHTTVSMNPKLSNDDKIEKACMLYNAYLNYIKDEQDKIDSDESNIAKYEAKLFAIENPTLLKHAHNCL